MNETTKQDIKQILNQSREENSAVDYICAVTADGLLIAESDGKDFVAKRIAAMGGTSVALGDRIAREFSMGVCQNVVIDCEKGCVYFMRITQDATLAASTVSEHGLGLLINASRNCAEQIKQLLS